MTLKIRFICFNEIRIANLIPFPSKVGISAESKPQNIQFVPRLSLCDREWKREYKHR